MPSKAEDIQADVTARIVEALEGDLLPWRRGWKASANAGLCTSLSTGRVYAGINQILLQLASWKHEYESKWWGTFRQVQASQGHVRKGERGTRIVLFKRINRTRVDADGQEKDDTFCVMRSYVVFNAQQCEGLDDFLVNDVPENVNMFERHEQAEEIIESSGCAINLKGGRAYYCPSTDEITMPPRGSFDSPEAFYETAFHELCHFAESRTGFDRTKQGISYGLGELVAEMGSCLLMARLQLETRSTIENSAAYLKHWLKAIRQDKRFIFKAASQSQKAADWLWSRADSRQGKPTDGPAIVV